MGSNDPGGVDESKYKQGTGKQVSTPRNDNSPQMCVLITEESKSLLCIGPIGSQSRFCLAPRDAGYSNCGIKAHGSKNSGTSKFSPKVDCYYPPAGLSHG